MQAFVRRCGLQSVIAGVLLFCGTQPVLCQVTLWETYRDSGLAQYRAGNYAEAERLLRIALQTAETNNPNGGHVAKTLNDLALLYETQGKYTEAEALFNRALVMMQ